MEINVTYFPQYPRTEIRDKGIFIIYEDGSEEYWGVENDLSSMKEVAQEIQLGLQAIEYVKINSSQNTVELCYNLLDAGIKKEHLDDIMNEASSNHSSELRELRERICLK